MTITPVNWPSILRPQDFGYYPVNFDVSGGAAADGSEQVVASAGPSWRASMTLPVMSDPEVLALRALRTKTKGRAIPVRLPNFDGRRLSWPQQFVDGDATGLILYPGVTRNKALDGTIYEDPEIPDESEIVATVDDPAAIGATTIAVGVSQGSALVAGQQFGIGGRLYEIGSLTLDLSEGEVAHYTINFSPPLRLAAEADDVVKFTRPFCLMRIVNLNEEMKKLEFMRFATLNLEFQEYI